MPFVVEVEVWENGVYAVVVEAPGSIGPAGVFGAPNNWGGWWFAAPALRLHSGRRMRDVMEVDPAIIISYEGVRGENLVICIFRPQLETRRGIGCNHFENVLFLTESKSR